MNNTPFSEVFAQPRVSRNTTSQNGHVYHLISQTLNMTWRLGQALKLRSSILNAEVKINKVRNILKHRLCLYSTVKNCKSKRNVNTFARSKTATLRLHYTVLQITSHRSRSYNKLQFEKRCNIGKYILGTPTYSGKLGPGRWFSCRNTWILMILIPSLKSKSAVDTSPVT